MSQVETRTGTCPEHGTVEATRTMPRPSFPFFVYAIRRLLASRAPFRCPDCGAQVTTTSG